MQDRLNQIFRVRPGEMALVVALGLVLLSNSIAQQVSGIVAISGFLSEGGVNRILIVLLVDYLLILLTTGLQSLIVDRFDRIKLMQGLIFGFAMIFTVLRLMFSFHVPGWLNYSLLYLVSEQQWLFFPLIFWVLANDIFDITQTRRLFPVIASWGFVGKLVGVGIAALSPDFFHRLDIRSEELLTLNILVYMIAFLVVVIGLRQVKLRQKKQKPESVRETLTEGWDFVREVPSFRYLMLAIVALTLCDTIIEFRFLVVTDQVFTTAESYQRFYSLYQLGMILTAFAIQSFLTSRLIDKLNLKNVFLILPCVTLLGAIWMVGLPGLISGVGAITLLHLTRDTMDESGRKSFQALVPEERRGRVSIFMDSYLPAIGTILGCLIAGAIVWVGLQINSVNYFYVYLGVTILAALFAVWSILNLRIVYDSSLLNWRLKRRQRGASVLDKLQF